MDLLKRALPLAFVLAGCTSTVEVQTTPVDVAVPILSVGVENYVEIAIDVPPHPQGDITLEELVGDLTVVNPSGTTTMTFTLRLSTEGTATPELPVAYTPLNRPTYFGTATQLLTATAYGPSTSTPKQITESRALELALQEPRIYLIVSNVVTSVGFGDNPDELQLELKGITFNALVTKGFGSLGGALDLTGL